MAFFIALFKIDGKDIVLSDDNNDSAARGILRLGMELA